MQLSATYGDDNLLALSGLQHLAYCERQWALIHIEQIWTDSTDTLRGDYFHERVDVTGYTTTDDTRAVRSVHVVSRSLGLYGIADIVEFDAIQKNRPIQPVEYKVGKPKIEDWDRIQLAAQVMCLEEMYGVSIGRATLFYGQTRRRDLVIIDEGLRGRVDTLAKRAHELFAAGGTPRPDKKPRCRRCSLLENCFPYISGRDAKSYWELFGEPLGASE